MMRSLTLKKVLVLAVVVAGVVVYLTKVRPARQAVSETTSRIEDELGSLPPLERAAVVDKLGRDAIGKARARRR